MVKFGEENGCFRLRPVIFHDFPNLFELLWLLISSLAVLMPFILGGVAIYVLKRKKKAKNV
jgi:hypothetical protein